MLFQRLISANKTAWEGYLRHDFVMQLERGELAREAFLFYLKQDYIYLLNYAKCYARLALNATTARELRFAMKFQNYIIDGELELHRSILALGIAADSLTTADESLTNFAYTRYMLSVGERGDFLDMLVALSACAIGYGYIGREIVARLRGAWGADFSAKFAAHPYREWIETYAGEAFAAEIKEFEDFVDSYSPDEAKFARLSEIFAAVVRCETAFWQHGLEQKMEI